MREIRPNWRTVRRPRPLGYPVALAAYDAACFCGNDVLEDEPIVCIGIQTVQEPDGTRTVDLSGAIWRCQGGHE